MMKLTILAVLFAIALFHISPGSAHHEDHGGYYKFNYGVSDPHTGDKKEQYEERHGHAVKGSYTLHEPDGTTRLVEYHAGPHGGFNAVVNRIGHAAHPHHGHSWVGVTHYGYQGH